MKLVQIVYLTILTAASATARVTEVMTADSPQVTVLECQSPCTLEAPSNCPTDFSPVQKNDGGCWACCQYVVVT
ncbi:hypothetical protein BDR03DRAFT_964509 [Suillus americanus]|nr:hypothetical protein BDR03DRAFT_964509 [Suillus americanus]